MLPYGFQTKPLRENEALDLFCFLVELPKRFTEFLETTEF